ncbi:MAG: iron ABC transporter permease [Candidatus Competibacteraceae bacterium]|nr:MAG: iron ABC transporter permease [Candidatus Competibacteraceae bacterium]
MPAPTRPRPGPPPGPVARWFDHRHVLFVGLSLFVFVVVVYPLLQVALRSILVQGEFSLANYEQVFLRRRNYLALWNSLWVSAIATLLATIIGVFTAFLVQRTDIPARNLWRVLLVLPFAIPPLFSAMGWVQLAGPVGLLSQVYKELFGVFTVPWNLYSPGGIIFVLAVSNYPFVFITVAGALARMDSSLEEAARTSGVGPWRVMRDITLPLVRPAILGGALLAFVSSIDNFGIPAVLGLRAQFYVLTTRIYEALTIPNLPLATAMSMLLVGLALLAMLGFRRAEGHGDRYAVVAGKSVLPNVVRLGRWRAPVVAGLALLVTFIVLLPLFALVLTSLLRFWGAELTWANLTLDHYHAVLNTPAARRGIVNSLILAFTAATVLVVATALISYLTVKAKLRGAGWLDAAGIVPFALPGSVIGVSMILAWSNPPFGPTLYGTIWILLIAYLMRYMAFGLQATRATLQQIHGSLEEAALTAGASRLRALKDITLPLLRPGMIAGWVLIFISAFNELTVSVLIWTSGSETIGVWIFLMQDSGFTGRASALAALTLPVILILYLLAQWLARLEERRAGKGPS